MKSLLIFITMMLVMSVSVFANAPQQEEKMVAIVLMMDDGDDQSVISTIYTSLMTAEKVAKLLDVELIAEDEGHRAEEKIQALTDKKIADIDKTSSTKEADLMEV